MKESVIDFPKEALCPEIWEKVLDAQGINEVWQLVPSVQAKIQEFIESLIDTAQLPQPEKIHITGSITSNQYTENADIDIHFLGFNTNELSEDVQKRLTDSLKSLRETNKELTYIGNHPFEVYYQTNEFQDYMSVGCYDFINSRWLVGPELTDPKFNPYSEYYQEINEYAQKLTQQVRTAILDVYEKAIVLKKNIENNSEESTVLANYLKDALSTAIEIFDTVRESRKVFSSPTSKEEALKNRLSRKWKIADATFKLLDKYGYLAMLREFKELNELFGNGVDIEVCDAIIDIVKKNFGNKEKLMDSEELLEEGIFKTLTLASLLAILGIMPQDASADVTKSTPTKQLKVKNREFQNNLVNLNNMRLGNFAMTNAINILSWTLYGEAGNQSKRGKEAVASVILNRAGGVPAKLTDVALNPNQFSMWNPDDKFAIAHKLKRPTSDADYDRKFPKTISTKNSDRISWNDAVEIATRLALGKFKSTIGNRNSYLNIETTKKYYPNSKALGPNGWATTMTDKLKIEDHTFGYRPENDGYKMNKIPKGDPNTTEYTVKRGDSLWKIAKMFNTSSKTLAQLNGISLSTPLKIGQKIKLKSSAPIAAKPSIHIVQPGDTLWKIAKQNNVSVKSLQLKNDLSDNSILKIGQRLKI